MDLSAKQHVVTSYTTIRHSMQNVKVRVLSEGVTHTCMSGHGASA